MSALAPHHVFSYVAYLEHEKLTGAKHEFVNGQVFAMSGGTPEHARLTFRVAATLDRIVDPKKSRIFSSDLKVRVRATGLATYPDVAIVCGELELDREDALAVVNPKVLVEVLSPSTEAYDRGEKWSHFRRIESLEAYVLVSPSPQRLECYERRADGAWGHRVAEKGETLALACLGGEIAVDPLFEQAIA